MAVINAQVYQETERLAEWSQPVGPNLEELLKAIVQTKEYLNNYLTDLSAKTKSSVNTLNKPVEEDEDCDEPSEDPLAEMFKKLSDSRKAVTENSENSVKRKNNSRNTAKKRRR